MTSKRRRLFKGHDWEIASAVDTHMHLWHQRFDLPEAFGRSPVGYSLQEYRESVRSLPIDKAVLIRAALPASQYGAESRRLAQLCRTAGFPSAEIGYLDPDGCLEESAAEEVKNPLFRGVRLLAPLDYTSYKGRRFLGVLEELQLVYDVVCHARSMPLIAQAASEFSQLQFVIEHAGWPESASDYARWREEMSKLARLDNVACKISGLPMAFGTASRDALAPWVTSCLKLYGSDRCMFGSNMPVDRLVAPLHTIFSTYYYLAAESKADMDAVFRRTAERIYRV